jgi:hypothetical protein
VGKDRSHDGGKSLAFYFCGCMAAVDRETSRGGRIPVLIGDDIGVRTTPHLGQFWRNSEFTQIAGSSRIAQLRLLDLLTRKYDVISVGMRSGVLEGPALLGMRTVYLEEAGNQQPGRMEQWLKTMPNYIRVILDSPPGKEQKEAFAAHLERIASRLQRPKVITLEDQSYIQLLERRAKELRGASKPDVFDEQELASILLLMKVTERDFSKVPKTGRLTPQNIPMKDAAVENAKKKSVASESPVVSNPMPHSQHGYAQAPMYQPHPGHTQPPMHPVYHPYPQQPQQCPYALPFFYPPPTTLYPLHPSSFLVPHPGYWQQHPAPTVFYGQPTTPQTGGFTQPASEETTNVETADESENV